MFKHNNNALVAKDKNNTTRSEVKPEKTLVQLVRECVMKLSKINLSVLIVLLAFVSVSVAGDFDWMKDFSIKAEADPSGFKARLSSRFKIGNAEINAVLSNVDNSADAYMILRFGEMSGQPTQNIIRKYKSGKGKGWGVLAKSLGIKPGSKEFKALKNGEEFKEKRYTDKIKNKEKKGNNKRG